MGVGLSMGTGYETRKRPQEEERGVDEEVGKPTGHRRHGSRKETTWKPGGEIVGEGMERETNRNKLSLKEWRGRPTETN